MSIASTFGRGRSFYQPGSEHELVVCPDCGLKADALFGDHGGECLDARPVSKPTARRTP